MIDINTAQEYKCKTTYGCALKLIDLGLLDYADRFNAANSIKAKLNKEKEYLGFLYYSEPIALKDYYNLI